MTIPDRRATIMILDGARPDVFDSLASAGDLPNITRYVLEQGGSVPATTVFPSTTGVAYMPLLNGCFPGTCDVPGIRWVDLEQYGGRWWHDRRHVRSYCGVQGSLLNTDVPAHIRSLFDLEPDSVALCTPFSRGLSPGRELVTLPRLVWGSLAHYTGHYQSMDRSVARELRNVARLASRLVFAVFPTVDGLTHFFDPWHPKVLDGYRYFDEVVGRYARRGGFSGDHLIAIVSDHGSTKIDLHTDVSVELEAFGLRTLRHPILWRRDPHVAVMISGNASGQVYLRPGHKRSHRWSVSEIEGGEVPTIPREIVTYLAELEGVALVAGVDGEDVTVVSRDGRATLSPAANGRILYTPESADVLALGTGPFELSPDEWLTRSFDGPYPDAPVQLMQIFRSARTGDLVVAAAAGADLRKDWEIPEHRSGHGGLVPEHMKCVVAVNQPMVGPIRTVDIFPLVVRHLGYEIPAGVDGVLRPSFAEAA
jgi:hypothetical protein